jgi:membrane-bound metal-dependent hydrolase YbcI (DUF457 family)
MLPFGHVAAGYLLSESYLLLAKPAVSFYEARWLIGIGTFSSFAPDLDIFIIFFKERGLRHTGAKGGHRDYLTHAPLFWLALALFIGIIGRNVFWRSAGVLVLLGSWSHFLLDSTDVGVRWLYPFSRKFFALKNPGLSETNDVRGFFPHWWNLLKKYWSRTPLTVCTEICLVFLALMYLVFLPR